MQPSGAGSLWSFCYPKQEVGAVRIVTPISAAVRFTDQLRDEMEIPDRTKVVDDLAETAVGVYLLQVCLRHSLGIVCVFIRGPTEHGLAVALDDLASEDRPMASALLGGKGHLVRPPR